MVGCYKRDVLNGHCGLRPAPVRVRAGGGAQSARVYASQFPLSIGLLPLFSVFQALGFHCGITVPQFSAVIPGRNSECFEQIAPMRAHDRLCENVLIQPGTIDKSAKFVVIHLGTLAASFLLVVHYSHISFSLISLCTSSATSNDLL